MTYTFPKEERTYLRCLAKRQAEIAALPIMDRRKQMWTDMNDGKPGTRPPFAIESRNFHRDFLPESLLQCKSDYGRKLERQFLYNIRNHDILNDDHVCPDAITMEWHVTVDEFGIDIPTEVVPDADGVLLGFHYDYPIKDLSDGFDMLKPAKFEVDKEGTLAEKHFLEETFADILPVEIRSKAYEILNFPPLMLTFRLIPLMGMQTFFMAMYDCPDKLHAIMAYLRDNAVRMAHWAEAEGLLTLNNANQSTCGTCFNFTTLLPKREVEPGEVKLSDLWAHMNSQETIGVSPELFHEFCFPYYRDLAEMFGLIYWGCCEPADPIWETSLCKLPNLKAVSISRWANQQYMAEALDGTGVIYSRKPNPNLLSVDVLLNEDAWAAEIRSTLELTHKRDINIEFIVRDVLTVHGNLDNPRRAVEIAKREIDRYYPAC